MNLLRKISLSLMVLAGALLTGCGTYMPLHEKSEKVDAAAPLYLMTVTIDNQFKPYWQPKVINVMLVKGNEAKPAEGKESKETVLLRMDSEGQVEPQQKDGVSTFLVRFKTDGTSHVLDTAMATAVGFPIVGQFALGLQLPVPSKTSGVHYLGAVKAVVRERKDNEFRAGPVIPLFDQAVAGASTGTFDVVVSDQFDQDMALFKERFPALKNAQVEKSLLPAWDRAKIQALWEKN